jgi:spermidine synthase
MPWLGLERTLHAGIVLNLLLALAMVVTASLPSSSGRDAPSNAQGEPATAKPPTWHSASVYFLAPAIPALIALLFLATATPSSLLRWDLSQMTLGVFRVSLAASACEPETWGEPEIVYYNDGLSTTVSVERWGRHYALKNNGKVDASNGDDMPTQIMVGAYPLLMHPEGPEDLDVAVVGFGSGVTVGTTLQFPVTQVDVIELEESIVEASWWFRDVNHLSYRGRPAERDTPFSSGSPEPAASGDGRDWAFPYVDVERLRVINDDGRNYLASTPTTYDVIISEPSNPWLTGVSDLFTTDHFEITKERLAPGGVYCQWVQLYEMSPKNIKTIYRTFASSFEHVVVFSAEEVSSDTVLLGSDRPLPLDLERIEGGIVSGQVARELERAGVDSVYDVLARTLLGSRDEVLQYTQIEYERQNGGWKANNGSSNDPATRCADGCRREPAPLNTDDNARIEFAAPRDLIGYEQFRGYLSEIYSPDWPYGRVVEHASGFGSGDAAAARWAELAMALIAHGRKAEASEALGRAQDHGQSREALVAMEVLSFLLSPEGAPPVTVDPPEPGPALAPRQVKRLTGGFRLAQEAVDRSEFELALAHLNEIPAPLRDHSGPGLGVLRGYLLYQTGARFASRYVEAIAELEDVAAEHPRYVDAHPEVRYYLARAHDAELNFDEALSQMRRYVEAAVVLEKGRGKSATEPATAEESPMPPAPPEDNGAKPRSEPPADGEPGSEPRPDAARPDVPREASG